MDQVLTIVKNKIKKLEKRKVLAILETLRELNGQFIKLDQDARVSFVWRVQAVLTCLEDKSTVWKAKQIDKLLKFRDLVTPTRDGGRRFSLYVRVTVSTIHLLSLANRKVK